MLLVHVAFGVSRIESGGDADADHPGQREQQGPAHRAQGAELDPLHPGDVPERVAAGH
jgi:hypothetical protein